MSRIVTLLFTAVITIVGMHMSAQTESPSVNENLKFDERIYDFGTIEESAGKVTHKFRFTNKGRKPAVLIRARSGCSCVKAEVPKRPIAPGASAYVTVTYDPNYRPGTFSKEIQVISENHQYNRIWVKGTVNPGRHPVQENYPYEYSHGLWMNLKRMAFGTVASGTEKTMKLKFANDCDSTMRLTFEPATSDAAITLIIPSGHILPAHGEAEMPVTMRCNRRFAGQKTINVYPLVNGNRLDTPLEVTVLGEIKN